MLRHISIISLKTVKVMHWLISQLEKSWQLWQLHTALAPRLGSFRTHFWKPVVCTGTWYCHPLRPFFRVCFFFTIARYALNDQLVQWLTEQVAGYLHNSTKYLLPHEQFWNFKYHDPLPARKCSPTATGYHHLLYRYLRLTQSLTIIVFVIKES